MKRTTLFVALASALSFSLSAYAHESSSQNQSEWSKATRRVEGMQNHSPDLVKQAQEKLGAMGKQVGKPDGQMGPKTQQALKEYQQENGLQPTGQLDQQTLSALDLNQSGSAATGGSSSDSQGNRTGSHASDSD